MYNHISKKLTVPLCIESKNNKTVRIIYDGVQSHSGTLFVTNVHASELDDIHQDVPLNTFERKLSEEAALNNWYQVFEQHLPKRLHPQKL